jgi:Type I restriction modification DNA specificity domain
LHSEAYRNSSSLQRSPINYLRYALNAGLIYQQATKVATGTAQKTVPLSGLRRITVPLPPLPEQHHIAAELERCFSIANKAQAQVDVNLERAAGLRQALLGKAFMVNPKQFAFDELEETRSELMATTKLPPLPPPRKTDAEDERVDIRSILSRYPNGLAPEQLFVEAGYKGDQIDQFYRDLIGIEDQLEQLELSSDFQQWPFAQIFRIALKKQ